MENEITITREQFDNLLKLSGIEIAADTQEDMQDLTSRALIALERKLNFFNFPLSFFTAEVINVLIIDDTELSIFQLSTMLQKIGMNVYVARSKEEAYAEFKKKNFDFLVLDLYLPDYTDGFDLIREANRIKNEENRDFKIIAISGTDNPQIIQEAYKLEIDEFISKAPQWHEKVLTFISNSANKIANEEYSRFYVNDNICALSLYKINNEKYVDKIIKEVNANVLTGKYNIIFNMEHIKIFSDNYSNLFSEVYKAASVKDGIFVLVKPCEDVVKALEYVFLTDAIPTFNTIEDAVEYIEMNNIAF
ncbi:MAG: response regulator [Candidatus Gastranaerophilales bacterium]|nr:response regulator [Candidatus Gastranaerophilales bacterium]